MHRSTELRTLSALKMEDFCIRIADLNIAVSCRDAFTRRFCADYLIPDCAADLFASASDEQIAADAAELETANLAYAECMSIYRSIAEQLPARERLVWHGAAVEYGGRGFLFTAPSGTGKSTHAALWRKYLGGRMKVINGDKPVISCRADAPVVFGTPWGGKEGWQNNCAAPLAAVCLLQRGTENRIERADPGDFLEQLFQQVYLPRDSAALAKTLELVDRLLRTVPFYVLHCDISEDAFRTSFETLSGEQYTGA